MSGKAIIDAEFEAVKTKRSLMPAVKYVAAMLVIGALLFSSMAGFFLGILWIAVLIYNLFWSILGALVGIVGGLIVFTWAASAGAEINRRWKSTIRSRGFPSKEERERIKQLRERQTR